MLSATLIKKKLQYIYCFSSVIVLSFKYWTVTFPIVSFANYNQVDIVIWFTLVSSIVITIRSFNAGIRIFIMVRIVCLLYLIRLGFG